MNIQLITSHTVFLEGKTKMNTETTLRRLQGRSGKVEMHSIYGTDPIQFLVATSL